MLESGPERYEIIHTPEAFAILWAKGTNKFSGLAKSLQPKLYIAGIDEKPVYLASPNAAYSSA